MRRALLIKRGRNSLFLFSAAIVWVGFGMGIDMKSGLIAGDFSAFVEKKLSSIFSNSDVKLAGIGGGVFRNLTVDELTVCQKVSPGSTDKPAPVFSVDKIIVKYNLMDLARRRFDKFGGVYLVSPSLFFVPGRLQGMDNYSVPHKAVSAVRSSAAGAGGIKVHILNGNIFGANRNPILSNLEGDVTFSNSALVLNNLKGNFLNLPVIVSGRIIDPLQNPVIKLRLTVKEKYYTARFAFKSSGQKGEGAIQGSAVLFDRFTFRYSGKIGLSSQETIEIKTFLVDNALALRGEIDIKSGAGKFEIKPKEGLIKVSTGLRGPKGMNISADINHLNIFGNDIISQVDISTNVCDAGNSPAVIKGDFRTRNLIVNYRPFDEIRLNWILSKGKLFINNFEIGNSYRAFGKVTLKKPYDMDLNLVINNADLKEWIVFSPASDNQTLSGILNGRLNIRGPMLEAVTKGRLEVSRGNIKSVKFDSINFNLNGKGPILMVSDSRIFKEGGFLSIDGEIDLRKFGKRNIFEDLQIKTDQRVIVWEGWDISKDITSSEIKLNKDIGEDFQVNFKTYSNTTAADQERKENEIGLDYKIRDDDSVNVRMKDNSAFVGVEHKVKF